MPSNCASAPIPGAGAVAADHCLHGSRKGRENLTRRGDPAERSAERARRRLSPLRAGAMDPLPGRHADDLFTYFLQCLYNVRWKVPCPELIWIIQASRPQVPDQRDHVRVGGGDAVVAQRNLPHIFGLNTRLREVVRQPLRARDNDDPLIGPRSCGAHRGQISQPCFIMLRIYRVVSVEGPPSRGVPEP